MLPSQSAQFSSSFFSGVGTSAGARYRGMANAGDRHYGRRSITQFRSTLLISALVIYCIFNGIVTLKDAGSALNDRLLSGNSSRSMFAYRRSKVSLLPPIPRENCEAPKRCGRKKTNWEDILSAIDPSPPRWFNRLAYETTAAWTYNFFLGDKGTALMPSSKDPSP